MTAKRTVSIPDDVAAWLDRQNNVSAVVTDAIRARMGAADVEEALRRAGFEITEEGKARWRARLARPIPSEVLAEGRSMAGTPADGSGAAA